MHPPAYIIIKLNLFQIWGAAGLKSFPKPLSAREEREYLKQCLAGSKEARDILIERNLRLVAYIVKKYNNGDKDMDDLISIGTIGLIKAIDTFKMDRGIRLATYASRCIDNELLMMIRSEKKSARDVYLYESIGADKEGNEISLIDIIESTDEDITERIALTEDIGKLGEFIEDCLNERERQLIEMRYGLNGNRELTQREIASHFGISRSYVSRIEKKALGKLRKKYQDSEKT